MWLEERQNLKLIRAKKFYSKKDKLDVSESSIFRTLIDRYLTTKGEFIPTNNNVFKKYGNNCKNTARA